MSNNQIIFAREWCNKAREDELSIQAILKEGAPSTACFLAQQMTEKYLKGLLVYFQHDVPKVHDLLVLETKLLAYKQTISQFHNDFVLLNRYYIETRYPGDYPEFSQTEAEAALAAALRIKNFVVHIINS